MVCITCMPFWLKALTLFRPTLPEPRKRLRPGLRRKGVPGGDARSTLRAKPLKAKRASDNQPSELGWQTSVVMINMLPSNRTYSLVLCWSPPGQSPQHIKATTVPVLGRV